MIKICVRELISAVVAAMSCIHMAPSRSKLFLIAYKHYNIGNRLFDMEKSEIRNKIGDRIRQLRGEQGLTQERFALMTGLNRSYLADIEKGNRNFGIDTLSRIVEGFGLHWSSFFEDM